jgi:flavodoxin
MKKAIIVFRSKTGITATFAYKIGEFLQQHDFEPEIISIEDFNNDLLKDKDILLLGCWTDGILIAFQHPDKTWVQFAKTLPPLNHLKIGLFTTYKIATGSMFRKMRKHLPVEPGRITLEIKSRNGYLTDANEKTLLQFIST